MPAQTPGLAALDEYLDALDARVDSATELLAEQAAQIGALTERVAALEAAIPAPVDPEVPVDPETPEEPLPEPEPEPDPEPGPDPEPVPDPPTPDDAPVPQYLVYDGANGGATREFFNKGVELKWKNPGVGDWIDADGVEQGPVPFLAKKMSGGSAGLGPKQFDVTALVQKQLATGENKGFMMQSEGTAFPYTFAGRLATDPTTRPLLTVTTEDGAFNVRATGTMRWALHSYGMNSGQLSFRVQKDQTHSIVQFDYSTITGKTVQSAVMTLHVLGEPRAGTINIFEANPPRFRYGRNEFSRRDGLAAQHPRDIGLKSHPSVIRAIDFLDDETGEASAADFRASFALDFHTDPETGLPFHRCKISKGKHEIDSGSMHFNFTRAVPEQDYAYTPNRVLKEAFFRYRVRFHKDWKSHVDGGKMPGWDLRFGYWRTSGGGYYQGVAGNGGIPGDGRVKPSWHSADGKSIVAYHGHMCRGHHGQYYPGNPYSEHFIWPGSYVYHIDQDSYYGWGVRWGGSVLRRGQWHDIEQRIKINTVSGPKDQYGNQEANPDGELEVWVDGVQVYLGTKWRWTRHADFGVEAGWIGFYHGGKQPAPFDMHVDIGNIVIADQYIGPVEYEG